MYAFEYLRASSVSEAAQLLGKYPEAKLLAGGQTFIPTMKARLAQPSHVIDLGRVKELTGIEVKGGVVTIGAMTRHVEVANSAEVKRRSPRSRRWRWKSATSRCAIAAPSAARWQTTTRRQTTRLPCWL